MKELLSLRSETNQLAEEAYSKGAMTGPSDLQFPVTSEEIAETSAAKTPEAEIKVKLQATENLCTLATHSTHNNASRKKSSQ